MNDEREKRIEAARLAGAHWFATHPDGAFSDEEWRDYHGAVLDAADEAVPVVSLRAALGCLPITAAMTLAEHVGLADDDWPDLGEGS